MATKKKAVKKVVDEKRFYVIVPERVTGQDQAGKTGLTHCMEPGRLIAQGFHVGRKIENARLSLDPEKEYEEITCIVLSVRNSREMSKIANEISLSLLQSTQGGFCSDLGLFDRESKFKLNFEFFKDKNDPLYGREKKAMTAIAIGPVKVSDKIKYLDDIIGHLELYGEF